MEVIWAGLNSASRAPVSPLLVTAIRLLSPVIMARMAAGLTSGTPEPDGGGVLDRLAEHDHAFLHQDFGAVPGGHIAEQIEGVLGLGRDLDGRSGIRVLERGGDRVLALT